MITGRGDGRRAALVISRLDLPAAVLHGGQPRGPVLGDQLEPGPPPRGLRPPPAFGDRPRPRPVTVTGAPVPSATLAGSGSRHTVAGTGAGIRPGQGRSGGRSGSRVSPNGTSVACSPGLRPPAGTGRVTAPWPSMACTRSAARATRSLTTASPHRPSWRPRARTT